MFSALAHAWNLIETDPLILKYSRWPTWPTSFKYKNKGRHLKVPLHPTLPHSPNTSTTRPWASPTLIPPLVTPSTLNPHYPCDLPAHNLEVAQPLNQDARGDSGSCSQAAQGGRASRTQGNTSNWTTHFFHLNISPSFKYITHIILQPGSVTDLEIYQIIEYSNHSPGPVTQVALAVLAMEVFLVINIGQISTFNPLLTMVIVHMKFSHISISNSKSP